MLMVLGGAVAVVIVVLGAGWVVWNRLITAVAPALADTHERLDRSPSYIQRVRLPRQVNPK